MSSDAATAPNDVAPPLHNSDMAVCEWCGVTLPPGGGPGRPRKFCCASHRQLDYAARRRGVDLSAIAERDEWRCYLCKADVPRWAVAPDPWSATWDHVVPVSAGGPDHEANIRLAHLWCNIKKGAGPIGRWDPPPANCTDVRFGAVTKPTGPRRCRWCGRGFEVLPGSGRPPEFCRRSCRQRAYESRRRSSELGLSESELVVTRAELDALRDALYVVEAAVEDVDRDLAAAGDDPDEVRRSLDWLLEAVRPLLALRP